MLGPTLFLIFINDLPLSLVSSHPTLYADDTSLLIRRDRLPRVETAGNNALWELKKWLDSNALYLNMQKSNFVLFGRREESVDLSLGGQTLERSSEGKMLGLLVDDRLSWRPHIKQLRSRLSSAVYALRKVVGFLDKKTIKSVYYAQINSLLAYGLIFWGGSSDSEDLFRIQKWAIRVIKGVNKRTSCRPFFKDLQILPLPSLYIYEVIIFTRRNIEKFPRNSDFHSYFTRGRDGLRVDKHRMALYERGPRAAGISLYNKLPRRITNLDDRNFKLALREELVNGSFYSVEEFVNYLG